MAASNSRSSSTLPSRKGIATNKMSKPQASNLQILLQMGFPKHRAEKALAATGNHSAELATKWLLDHVNDPFIDDNSPREYILYACPKGPLLHQLKQFWEKSLYLYGWNGAHNFTPHITLVSFFKTPDEDAPHLVKSLESVMERDGAVLNETLKLETYTSPNFMGFFVAEDHADYLKRIAMQFVKEVSNAIISDTYEHFDALTACFPWCTTTTARCIPRGSRSISLEPHVKSLHLTLAYQFPSSQYNCLKAMVDELDSSASGEWELRLYSRDPRLNGKQVYKVIRDYRATECDDLELGVGDYVYVSSEAFNNSATDRWLEGTSWLTGCSGFFPESYTVRTAESDAWALHTSIPLNILGSDTEYKNDMGDDSLGLQQIKQLLKNHVYLADLKNMSVPDIGTSDNDVRKIFIMRHGERVDFVFGNWVQHSFDESGNYIRKDLNMPESLPTRNPGPEAYVRDGPVTNIGLFQAELIGKFFKEKNIEIQHVYSSPSFRCVQTCDSFLKGLQMKDKLKIRVDPSLFEWLHWYPEQFPTFMSEKEQISAGFNVDTEYIPYMSQEQLSDHNESWSTYYERSTGFTKKILETYPSGNVLIVGHASTLDTCSRELVTGQCRNADSLLQILQKIPYCSLAQFTYDGTNLHCTEPPCPSITHSTNTRFDWKVLLSE